MNSELLKEYGWSFLVTFLASFILAFQGVDVPADMSALYALAAASAREAFRAAFNLVVTSFMKRTPTTISSRPQ